MPPTDPQTRALQATARHLQQAVDAARPIQGPPATEMHRLYHHLLALAEAYQFLLTQLN